jgi:heme-degrading monooxygenase HmoA
LCSRRARARGLVTRATVKDLHKAASSEEPACTHGPTWEEGVMHARVSTYQSPAEQLTDEAVEQMRAALLQRISAIAGNRGVIMLMDRTTGKSISITLWESEDALRASDEQAKQLRSEAAQQTSGQVGDVEVFEAPIVEVSRTADV